MTVDEAINVFVSYSSEDKKEFLALDVQVDSRCA
jgi:hypothetical protein